MPRDPICTRIPSFRPRHVAALAWAVTAALGCARNPATGRVELSLLTETEEVALGREADLELREALPLYAGSQALDEMVQRVGARIAATSERPNLPWTFRIIDDPSVNALALPGGFVFVTRGMLTHLSSEDELAAVLAHEAGHVAAKHGVAELRRLASAGRETGQFSLIDPTLAGAGASSTRSDLLRALRHTRAEEDMADTLSLRYLERARYDGGALSEVFGILAAFADAEPAPAGVASTHPDPRARRARVAEVTGVVERDEPEIEYLQRLDGVLFGMDPQLGFAREHAFLVPARGFRVDLPQSWSRRLGRATIVATAPKGDAMLVVGPSDAESARAGLDAFVRLGVRQEETTVEKRGDYRVESTTFVGSGDGQEFRGQVAFFDAGGQLFVMLAIAQPAAFSEHAKAIEDTMASLASLSAAERSVDAMRIELAYLPEESTLAEHNEKNPSSVPLQVLARLNHVKPDEILSAGRPIKRVVGYNPEFGDDGAR